MLSSETKQFVRQHCNQEQHLSALTHTLTSWCETESGSYHLDGLAEMADILSEEVSELTPDFSLIEVDPEIQIDGITGETLAIPLGHALLAKCRPQAPIQILLNGHMDTVYGVDHPFKKCTMLDTNTMNGPAVADMKGGLLVMLRAAAILERHPAASNIGWQILIGADEEIGSPGTTPLLKQAAAQCHLGLIYESSPIGGSLVRNRMGSGSFLIRAIGKSVHVGKNFSDGKNAIEAVSRAVTDIQNLNHSLPQIRFNTGKIGGGDALNTVPDRAYARLNVRVSTANDAKLAEVALKQICDKVATELDQEIILEGGFTRPAKVPDAATTRLYHSIAEIGKSFGQNLGWHDTGGGADGSNLLAYGLPNLDSLGVIGGNLHSKDEFIMLDSICQRIQLSAAFLIGIASGEIELEKILESA